MKKICGISCAVLLVRWLASIFEKKKFFFVFFLLSFAGVANGISYFWLKFIEFDTNKTSKARKKHTTATTKIVSKWSQREKNGRQKLSLNVDMNDCDKNKNARIAAIHKSEWLDGWRRESGWMGGSEWQPSRRNVLYCGKNEELRMISVLFLSS